MTLADHKQQCTFLFRRLSRGVIQIGRSLRKFLGVVKVVNRAF